MSNMNMNNAWMMNMNFGTPTSSVGNPLSVPNSATGSNPNPMPHNPNANAYTLPHPTSSGPNCAMPNMLDLSSLQHSLHSLPQNINIQNVQNNISMPSMGGMGGMGSPFGNFGMPNLPPLASLPMPLPMAIPNLLSPQPSSENPSVPPIPMPSLMPIILTPDDAIKALANSQRQQSSALGNLPNLGARSMSQTDLTAAGNVTSNDVLVRTLRAQLAREKAKMQLIQTAYWSLRSDFDNVCDVMKAQSLSMAEKDAVAVMKDTSSKKGKKGKGKTKLSSISEGESTVFKEELAAKLRDREQEFATVIAGKEAEVSALTCAQIELSRELESARKRLVVSQGELKGKVKESNKRNNGLERDVKNLKHKIKKLEKENKKFSLVAAADEQKAEIKAAVLGELYLNSNRVKEFMTEVKRAGEMYGALKKRQMEMMEKEKADEDALYRDIVRGEDSYRALYDSLDILKTESQGKELELMTRNKEYIALLEKEKFVQSSHLEEYVKKNQTLQLDLTDREMKLRQTQNELNHTKQRVSRLQNENDNFLDQMQSGHQQSGHQQNGHSQNGMNNSQMHSHMNGQMNGQAMMMQPIQAPFMANMNAQYPAHAQFNPMSPMSPMQMNVNVNGQPNVNMVGQFGGFNPNANPYAQ